jgi:hypothetical protein
MGPSILFDKSAIQSLGQEALHEVSRYFYTVVPPVLLMETLADLSLTPDDLDRAKRKVAEIADKVLPIDSIANADCYSMCVHNLLGEHVAMDRKPAVFGARPVTANDGAKGLFIDIQPENEAVLRWRSGQFNENDLRFALWWRESAKDSNLEAMKQSLPKPPIKMRTADQVAAFVDLLLAQNELQESLLRWFLGLLRCDQDICDRVLLRWKWDVRRALASFAPYAHHCLRVQLLYYTGMMQGIFGTRSSNTVDLEYLHYTPFAFVFCSGDKLHRELAPFVLRADQSFVERQEMHTCLKAVVAARQESPDVQPEEGSLIHRLWINHWNRPPSNPIGRAISEEESRRIMESVKPIVEALEEQEKRSGPRFPV